MPQSYVGLLCILYTSGFCCCRQFQPAPYHVQLSSVRRVVVKSCYLYRLRTDVHVQNMFRLVVPTVRGHYLTIIHTMLVTIWHTCHNSAAFGTIVSACSATNVPVMTPADLPQIVRNILFSVLCKTDTGTGQAAKLKQS